MSQPSLLDLAPGFDGATFDPQWDQRRLSSQLGRVFLALSDHRWHTLRELAAATHAPETSVSAQLRHLRKARFGAYTIERRANWDRSSGLYVYRLLPEGAA
jgi:hypothetical protein